MAAYESVGQLLDAGGIDGALIVTPSPTHLEMIKFASAGIAILCEKPCGLDPDDTRRAARLVADAGVPLQVAYWRRFVPELVALHDRIASGEFGELLSVVCAQWDGSPPAANFALRAEASLSIWGSTKFDQARWLTGGDLVDLRAVTLSVVTDPDAAGDPDAAQAIALATTGSTVVVSLGRYFPLGDVASVEIYGTRGYRVTAVLRPSEWRGRAAGRSRRQAAAFRRYREEANARARASTTRLRRSKAAAAAMR